MPRFFWPKTAIHDRLSKTFFRRSNCSLLTPIAHSASGLHPQPKPKRFQRGTGRMGPSQVKTDASFARAKIAAKASRLDVRRPCRTNGRTCVFFVMIIVASARKRAIHSRQKAPAQDSAEMSLRGIVSGHHVNLSMIMRQYLSQKAD